MKVSISIAALLLLSVARPAWAEDEFPQFSTTGASSQLHRLTVRAGQASTGERGGGSDAGAVAAMTDAAFSVPSTGVAVLALSASWCTPCRSHVAALTRLQQVLSGNQCMRAGDTTVPRVIEITDSSLLKAFQGPNSRNRASREAWGSSDLGHELVMVPQAQDEQFMALTSMTATGAGGPMGSIPGTLIVVDGRIVSISGSDGGLFAGEMDECAGISPEDRAKVQEYNAKTSACFVLRSTRKADGTNRVGANALNCPFTCPVARPEITCNGR